MKYKKYPSYKNSGVEWLGDIPEHWVNTKLKYIGEAIIGLTYSPNNVVDENCGTLVLRSSNLQNKIITYTDNVYVDADIPFKLITRENDILICSRNGSRKLIGKNALIDKSSEGFSFGAFTTVYRSNHNNFIYYILNSSLFEFQSGRFLTTTINQLTTGTLNTFEVPFPPIEEQQQIAKFLDNATQKMDTLIKSQERLIELLKEKRQAVISHAVTKGLNPDVKFKDSGVEWLGDVPEHWEIKPAQYVAKITRGAILRPVDAPEYFEDDGEWAYLNISDATKCDKYLSDSKLKLSKLGSLKSARVYPNNVIITASATIGKAFINKIKVCVHDGFIPFTEIKVYKDYLYHYLSNPFLYAAMGKSNTQKNIYLDEVKKMIVTVPPMEEQIKIVDYLEEKSLQMNILIKKATKSIKLLKEKRTALISSAVTGKIDVRELIS